MNARDKIYTGKVSEWGLPDGVVLTSQATGNNASVNSLNERVHNEYKIKSLPVGYKFNDTGEIVKVEVKRYWDGKEPLEVGMVGMMSDGHRKIMLPKDASGHWITQDDEGVNDVTLIEPNVNFFPVDTRTKKEKDIYEILSDVGCWNPVVKKAVEYCHDKWVGSDE